MNDFLEGQVMGKFEKEQYHVPSSTWEKEVVAWSEEKNQYVVKKEEEFK